MTNDKGGCFDYSLEGWTIFVIFSLKIKLVCTGKRTQGLQQNLMSFPFVAEIGKKLYWFYFLKTDKNIVKTPKSWTSLIFSQNYWPKLQRQTGFTFSEISQITHSFPLSIPPFNYLRVRQAGRGQENSDNFLYEVRGGKLANKGF